MGTPALLRRTISRARSSSLFWRCSDLSRSSRPLPSFSSPSSPSVSNSPLVPSACSPLWSALSVSSSTAFSAFPRRWLKASTPSLARPLHTARFYPSSTLGASYSGLPRQPPTDSPASSVSKQQRRSLSKLKAYKIKSYSAYKGRFKLMADGTFKRWRSGTRHNAHSKTAKQRRQLRRPSTAPKALATVMKKLHFVR